jgi:predicted site-specific integrase-resolvase
VDNYRVYRPHEFAKLIGKSTSTLRRWDTDKILVASRGAGGQRYYTEADRQKALNLSASREEGKTVVYCRVSSKGQSVDLSRQVEAMENYCQGSGIAVTEWIKEIGGGMNFKRKLFLKLMKAIRMGEVSHVIVAHKDRLARARIRLYRRVCFLVWLQDNSHQSRVTVSTTRDGRRFDGSRLLLQL